MSRNALRGVRRRSPPGADDGRRERKIIMAKRQQEPIITHVEIYSRAIRNILDEIKSWEDRCEGLPQEQKDDMVNGATAHLRPKLDALKEMYRLESGIEYE